MRDYYRVFEVEEKGFTERTLRYLKKNAEGKRPFTMYRDVLERLEEWMR